MNEIDVSLYRCPDCGAPIAVEVDPIILDQATLAESEVLVYCTNECLCGWVGTQFEAKLKGALE